MWGCEEVILEVLSLSLEQMLSSGTLIPGILNHLGTDVHKKELLSQYMARFGSLEITINSVDAISYRYF